MGTASGETGPTPSAQQAATGTSSLLDANVHQEAGEAAVVYFIFLPGVIPISSQPFDSAHPDTDPAGHHFHMSTEPHLHLGCHGGVVDAGGQRPRDANAVADGVPAAHPGVTDEAGGAGAQVPTEKDLPEAQVPLQADLSHAEISTQAVVSDVEVAPETDFSHPEEVLAV